jgi:hypothetical protein
MSQATLDLLKDIAERACAEASRAGQVPLVAEEHDWEGPPPYVIATLEAYRRAALAMGYVWDTKAGRWVQDGQAS